MHSFINWCYLVTILATITLCGVTYFNQKRASHYLENYFIVLENVSMQRDLIREVTSYSTTFLQAGSPSTRATTRSNIKSHVDQIEVAHSNFLLSSHFAEADSVHSKDSLDQQIENFIKNLQKFISTDRSIGDGSLYLNRAIKISSAKLLPTLDDLIGEYSEEYRSRLSSFNKEQLQWLLGSFGIFIALSIIILHPISRKIAKAYDQLVANNKTKAKLLAGMNYRLHDPINNIVNVAESFTKITIDERQKHEAFSIINSADIVKNTISDIVDFHKMETGKFIIEQKAIDLKNIAQKVIKPLSEIAKDKNLELKLEYSDKLSAQINGDSSRIVQVLSNLVSNALRFTEKGGVTIRIEPAESQNTLRVNVVDTGAGIEAEQQPVIFDWFGGAESDDDSNEDDGRGFGLSMVKTIVNEMGGEMGLDSTLGEGSNFWFTIPNNKAMNASVEATPVKENPNFVGLKLLIAEDNRVSREFSTKMFESLGCKIISTENGVEALEAVQKDKFDFVLMDCHMPEMDGFESTQKIKELVATKKIDDVPIVALTANTVAGDEEKSVTAGMDGYFLKPVKKVDYETMLNRCIKIKQEKVA